MRSKARENLEAALALRDLGLVNASASRLYFAVFQAAVHALARRRRIPAAAARGARTWSHGRVETEIAAIRGVGQDHRLFLKLKALREMADYDRDSVTRRDIDRFRPDAARFVFEVTS